MKNFIENEQYEEPKNTHYSLDFLKKEKIEKAQVHNFYLLLEIEL